MSALSPMKIPNISSLLNSTLSQPTSTMAASGPKATSSGGNLTPYYNDEEASRPRSGSDGPSAHRSVTVSHHPHGHGPPSGAYRSPVAKMFDSVFGSGRNRSNSLAASTANEDHRRKIVVQRNSCSDLSSTNVCPKFIQKPEYCIDSNQSPYDAWNL
ncbi:unnamed protein product [Notodromas monacha]|uniref:Uncharacterized protein n=1 Tax=Notodromas monacha TaxID=399045 RepID=A0A7R9BPK7_9CRUS|nr:unnamed protein product [Notodromas monacha]CAG0918257.1 unnamed protein product [Notodromas monacha]